jgi:hypothetical protein
VKTFGKFHAPTALNQNKKLQEEIERAVNPERIS